MSLKESNSFAGYWMKKLKMIPVESAKIEASHNEYLGEKDPNDVGAVNEALSALLDKVEESVSARREEPVVVVVGEAKPSDESSTLEEKKSTPQLTTHEDKDHTPKTIESEMATPNIDPPQIRQKDDLPKTAPPPPTSKTTETEIEGRLRKRATDAETEIERLHKRTLNAENVLRKTKIEIAGLRGMCDVYRDKADASSEDAERARREFENVSSKLVEMTRALAKEKETRAMVAKRVSDESVSRILQTIVQFTDERGRDDDASNAMREEYEALRAQSALEIEDLHASIDHYIQKIETMEMEIATTKNHNEYLEAQTIEDKHKMRRLQDAIQDASQSFERVVNEADEIFFDKPRPIGDILTTSSRSGRRIHPRHPVGSFYPGTTFAKRKTYGQISAAGLAKPKRRKSLHPSLRSGSPECPDACCEV